VPEVRPLALAGCGASCYHHEMKPVIRTFDSFADADAYTEEEQLSLTPEERIELCYLISMAGFELHHGELPQARLRDCRSFKVVGLKDQDKY
jgi:hypothetical protein